MTRLNELVLLKSKQKELQAGRIFLPGSAQGNLAMFRHVHSLFLSRTNIIKIVCELLHHNKIRTHAAPHQLKYNFAPGAHDSHKV